MTEGAARPDADARSIRLRAYQDQLLERMQAANSGNGVPIRQLGMQVGARRYLLDLLEAGEIVPPVPLARVPLTQPWYLGLANVRGSLVGVIDLARYLGLGETPIGAEARFVTFAPGLGMNCALLVSRILGLKNPDTLITVAETTEPSSRPSWQGEQLRDKESDLPTTWRRLHTAALLGDPGFLDITR